MLHKLHAQIHNILLWQEIFPKNLLPLSLVSRLANKNKRLKWSLDIRLTFSFERSDVTKIYNMTGLKIMKWIVAFEFYDKTGLKIMEWMVALESKGWSFCLLPNDRHLNLQTLFVICVYIKKNTNSLDFKILMTSIIR